MCLGLWQWSRRDRGILYEGVFGTRDIGKGPNMTRDTVFDVASMVKVVTSVAGMPLVEAGKLHFERSGTEYRPGAWGTAGPDGV